MRLTNPNEKRADTAVALNAKHPIHPFLNGASSRYTYTHAYPFDAPRKQAGPLPAELTLSRRFITTVIKAITPAEENWGNRRTHVFQKNSPYQATFAMYVFGFQQLIEVADDCIEVLLADVEDEHWPFTMTKQNFVELREGLKDLQERQKFDRDTAYVNLPWVVLVAFDLLLRVDSLFVSDWVQEELQKFTPQIVYPASKPSNYNLNVYYEFDYAPPTERAKVHSFLCGYSLGRVVRGKRRSGGPVHVLRLNRITITTVHNKHPETSTQRPGLICGLKICG